MNLVMGRNVDASQVAWHLPGAYEYIAQRLPSDIESPLPNSDLQVVHYISGAQQSTSCIDGLHPASRIPVCKRRRHQGIFPGDMVCFCAISVPPGRTVPFSLSLLAVLHDINNMRGAYEKCQA